MSDNKLLVIILIGVFQLSCKIRRQRNDKYCVNKKHTHERCDSLDREVGIRKTEEIEIETFPVEAEQPQDTAAEEMDDDYLQDPTTNGENCLLHIK